MKDYIKIHPWKVIENNFHPEFNRISESIFSLGNGHMGLRGNFEEKYSGDSLQGTYVGGVYYPDKTRVGWWKNGYPEYFAKVLNSTNWIGMCVEVDGEILDLNKGTIHSFQRILDMKEGHLSRTVIFEFPKGNKVLIESTRFVSMIYPEVGVLKYSITPLNFSADIKIISYLDGDVINEDSNYEEKFWEEVDKGTSSYEGHVTMKTKKLSFHLCTAMKYDVSLNKEKIYPSIKCSEKEKYIDNEFSLICNKNDTLTIYKYVAITSSRNHLIENLKDKAYRILNKAFEEGFHELLLNQINTWENIWAKSDIVIEGDDSSQQGIRFNIFQLYQTYTGEDQRLNIGPKGFTGEKYGGVTYWDTEAYCIPFYMSTCDKKIAKNLLIYRYDHLGKAKENARKLGFTKGALYPMVTMNGEECHNEWEITFEEIHRNGAIAYAIYNYVNYTGDKSYLEEYGFEVLVEISRFWEERVNFSQGKNAYVILGVTGPNEYENNVNNNWYTNRIAVWTLQYTLEVMDYLKTKDYNNYNKLISLLNLQDKEINKWKDIINHMYYPFDSKRNIFLQQDGFLDKNLSILAKDLSLNELPLNQHWSWDRILRSPYIKQADVLQGLYFLEHEYDLETIRKNFDFYEPLTVHESSLSPCVHSILASKLGYKDKAYELYLRTARLDLNDYNNDARDGCHITSMAGTWMSIVYGFAGMAVKNHTLVLNPYLPKQWESYSFNIIFRECPVKIQVNLGDVVITNKGINHIKVKLFDKEYLLPSEEKLVVTK